jgi:hypothetical protein
MPARKARPGPAWKEPNLFDSDLLILIVLGFALCAQKVTYYTVLSPPRKTRFPLVVCIVYFYDNANLDAACGPFAVRSLLAKVAPFLLHSI